MNARTSPLPSQIAIVGMSAIVPKAKTLLEFWDNILNKVYAITEIPGDRWPAELYFDPDRNARDKVYSKWGGFIDDVPFDPMEFGMPPNSLRSVDPMHLLALVVARAALADAGYSERAFDRSRTAVILGASGGVGDVGAGYVLRSGLPLLFGDTAYDIVLQAGSRLPEWTEDSFAGILMNVMAGRIANRFDLGGVNYIVDAACASSLSALHAAVAELESSSSDMVLAGGVDTVQNPFGYLCFAKTQALSPTGEPRVFDATADGIVIGEGLVMLVLKRLADAERDGNRIYAVIRGVAGSSDGKALGLTAPRPEGQRLALERAYAKAGVSPTDIGLFEAHGTGTVVGDRTEALALADFLEASGAAPQSCAIGSVKSMIGHTKATAGVAGLAKVAMALYHKVLPPTLGVREPNPKARLGQGPLYVNSETRPWIQRVGAGPRRAGVSAFGFGGTNWHAVLEEYEGGLSPRQAVLQRWPSELFLWSASSRSELAAGLATLEQALDDGARPELRELAYSVYEAFRLASPGPAVERSGQGAVADGRPNQSRVCLSIVAANLDDLRQKLAQARQGLADAKNAEVADSRGIYFTDRPLAPAGRIAFLFPGQGSQYPNMLRDLSVTFSDVRETFERADGALAGCFSKPLSGFVFPPPTFSSEDEQAQKESLTQTNVAQPALGAASMGLFYLLQTLGLRPDMVAGHSYGEYVALCAAGVIDEHDLLTLSEARGRCIIDAAKDDLGTMAAVQAGADAIAPILESVEGVWIANLNAPRQTIISGTKKGVAEAVRLLDVRGITARPIPVACAFHSPLVAPAMERLAQVLPRARFCAPTVEVFSNTTAAPYPPEPEAIRGLLVQHLVRAVRFAAEIEAMYARGARLFVEVGPRNVLTGLASQTLGELPHLAIALDLPGRSGLTQLLHALARLAVHGVPLSLERLFQGRTAGRLDLSHLLQETAVKPLPATTWLVNGGRARPSHEAENRSWQPIGLASEPGNEPAALPGPSAALSPVQQEPTIQVTTPGPEADQVMLQFQNLMDRFLETQRRVMLAYLQGAPTTDREAGLLQPTGAGEAGAVPSPQAPRGSPGGETLPVERQVGAMASGVAPAVPGTPPVAASEVTSRPGQIADQASPGLVQPSSLDREALTARLLGIVSERTGYPPEMLELDLDLEAGLGIDSIKRVEILGRLRQSFADTQWEPQGLDMEKLSALKTLRQVIDRVMAIAGAAAVIATAEPPSPGAPGGQEDAEPQDRGEAEGLPRTAPIDEGKASSAAGGTGGAFGTQIERAVLHAVERPLTTRPAGLAAGRTVLITDDGTGVAQEVGMRLQAIGHPVALVRVRGQSAAPQAGVYEADLSSFEDVGCMLALVRQAQGPVAGLIHLLPLAPPAPFEQLDLAAWRQRLALETRTLFLLASALRTDLESAAQLGGALLLAATGMGGTFASDPGPARKEWQAGEAAPPGFFPGQGAVSGFLKSAAKEWPAIRVKAVDLDQQEQIATLAEHLLAESMADDGQVEVGYCDGRRVVLDTAVMPLPDKINISISHDWVLLVTGGARGITADVALELAERYQPTLVLVGQSPLPPAEEGQDTAGLKDSRDLKAALMARFRADGQQVTLAHVERAYERLLKDREIRSNMAAMARAGARVHYQSVDVRDEQAFGALIDDIYGMYGRLDGVIHGAGIIEDKLIKDKTVESFDRVLGTKIDSAFILSRRLRPETLRFLVFFSSVAGRVGNVGQADYAAANEVYTKLAIHLNHRWPARVVAIIWAPWEKMGMVSPELQREFARRGVALLPPAEGRRWLDRELRHGREGEAEILIAGASNPLGFSQHENKSDGQAGSVAATSAPKGPLLDSATPIRTSNGVAVLYTLDPARDLMLNDHRLDGNAVLPAAEAMELMAETVKWGWPDLEVVRLRDIRVQRGVILRAGSETVTILAREKAAAPLPGSGRGGLLVDVEISDPSPAHRPYYRATAELVPSADVAPPPLFRPAFATPLEPFGETVSQAYDKYLFHGPRLQCIAEIEGINREGIVARVIPSSPGRCLAWQPAEPWLMDPVVIDGGFQLAIVWARIMHDITPLPSRFQAYHRYGPLAGSEFRCCLYCQADPDSLIMHTTLLFVNPNGQVIGTFEGAESTCSSRNLNRPVNGVGS